MEAAARSSRVLEYCLGLNEPDAMESDVLGADLETSVVSDGSHSVVHGDGVEYLASLDDHTIDLAFVDPPYNIGKRFGTQRDKWPSDEAYLDWCKVWIDLLCQKLAPAASVYIMASTQAMPHIDVFVRERMTILSRIVWHYDSSGVQAKRYYGSLYEPILFAVVNPRQYTFNADDIAVEAKTGAQRKLIDYRKPVPTVYSSTKVPGNVWSIPRVRYRMAEYEEHPSQKPEALLERIIRASSDPGDLVFDPFAGTFTTCAVAKRLGRRSIGVEANEDYVGVGLRRLGLATEFRGRSLQPISKTTARRNRVGRQNGSVIAAATQLELG
jgi:adenine-specific DNA-methyltransferase